MTAASISSQIERLPVDSLTPHAKNSRTHSDAQVNQIAASIKAFGFTNPVLVDEQDGIIAGHGRVMAARSLGLEAVPCLRLSGLTDAQKRAYVIADNQLALNAGWDEDLLRSELLDLRDQDFNLDLVGFNENELNLLLSGAEQVAEGLTDEDDAPEPEQDVVSKVGDVWMLGRHRLMCGDSTMLDHIQQLTKGATPDCIHTDPPYGMNAVSRSSVLKQNYKQDILGDDSADVAKDAFRLAYGLWPKAKHVWWGANYYSSVLPDSECWLVWDKNNGQSDQTDCELAWANFRSVVRQFTMASEKSNRVHPTQKPVALMEWILRRFKLSADTIADLFGGSGSTLIAAEKHGATSFVMELDPRFCDVIVRRWQNYTGNEAFLESTGQRFNELQKPA